MRKKEQHTKQEEPQTKKTNTPLRKHATNQTPNQANTIDDNEGLGDWIRLSLAGLSLLDESIVAVRLDEIYTKTRKHALFPI